VTKNPATWEEFPTTGAIITQNNNISIGRSGTGSADYTMTIMPVAVGQAASVELLSHPGTDSYAYLALTNNSGGTSATTTSDSEFLYLVSFYSPLGYGFHSASKSLATFKTTSFIPTANAPTSQDPYILMIERLSQTTAKFTVSQNGLEIDSSLHTFSFGILTDLYVSLKGHRNGGPLEYPVFDNVTITPEPATLLLLALGAAAIKKRK
jgi:hypothetical protein